MPGPSSAKRRTLVQGLPGSIGALAALASAGCGAFEPPPEPPPPRRPNVVLVLADDLGYGELGVYGQERIRTPNLDRLAGEGVRFTQYYSGHTVCAPSRFVLLTGLHTGHAYIRDNSPWARRRNAHGEGQEPILPEAFTVAEWLSDRGYATACVGKWGLGGPETTGEPTLQGFDRFFGYLAQEQAHDYYPLHLWRDGEKVELDNPAFTPHVRWDAAPEDPGAYDAFRGDDYAPDLMIEEALAWVEEQGERPFFLYFASPVPHLGLQVPEDALEPYADVDWDARPYLGRRSYVPNPTPRATYAAMVTRLDRDVGRLMELVGELGLEEDTLLLFASDNGPTFDIGGADSDFFESTAGLRGRKGSLYEGGIRVPFFARWPGRIEPERVSDRVWAAQDVFPTLCEVTGGSAPTGLDGISLTSDLFGEAARRDRVLYWEYGKAQALRAGDWKLVRTRRDGTELVELFDLASDPAERENVAETRRGVRDQLVGLIEAARVPSKIFPTPFDPPVEAEGDSATGQ